MKPHERKAQFIEALAKFLVSNQGSKSITLEIERKQKGYDPKPKWATEWAGLRALLPSGACSSELEAIKELNRILG